MLCPMKYPVYDIEYDKSSVGWMYCEGDNCAWWVEERRRCAIQQLSIQFRIFADSFHEDCQKEQKDLEDFINELDE